MDYERLIDAETWAFISRTGESYPDDAVESSVEDQRTVYNDMCREFRVVRPDVVEVEDLSADGVPVRHYWAGEPTRTVVFFHGGGFVVGGLDSTMMSAPRSAPRPATGLWPLITGWPRSTSTRRHFRTAG